MIKRISMALVYIFAALMIVASCRSYSAYRNSIKEVPSKPPLKLVIRMIEIPGGSFLMGSANKRGPYTQLPRHSVYLSSYAIGEYEITRGQYIQFIKAGGYSDPKLWSSDGWKWKVKERRTEPDYWASSQDWGTGTFIQTDKHPVIGVSYYEAEAFCKWAGGHLPTEAQWERAALWTGAHTNIYPWGDVWDINKLNHAVRKDKDYRFGVYGRSTHCQTDPVGSYPAGASPSGCKDMAGNVMEWCKDWMDSEYYAKSPKRDPQGPEHGEHGDRVQRGGGWDTDIWLGGGCLRRFSESPCTRNYMARNGFRLAR